MCPLLATSERGEAASGANQDQIRSDSEPSDQTKSTPPRILLRKCARVRGHGDLGGQSPARQPRPDRGANPRGRARVRPRFAHPNYALARAPREPVRRTRPHMDRLGPSECLELSEVPRVQSRLRVGLSGCR